MQDLFSLFLNLHFFWLDWIRLMSDVELETNRWSPSWVGFNEVHCWWRVLYSFAEGTWKGVCDLPMHGYWCVLNCIAKTCCNHSDLRLPIGSKDGCVKNFLRFGCFAVLKLLGMPMAAIIVQMLIWEAGRFENEQSLFYAAQITCIFECPCLAVLLVLYDFWDLCLVLSAKTDSKRFL